MRNYSVNAKTAWSNMIMQVIPVLADPTSHVGCHKQLVYSYWWYWTRGGSRGGSLGSN